MGRKKKEIDKEQIAESCCFVCKDGGMLRICDYGDCLKAYHPDCVNKDPSFLETDDPWNCDWHSCFMCKKPPKFHCICCPMAICARCLCDANFPVVGMRKGFCATCLELVALIEGLNDKEKMDFNDVNTYEYLFKSYWENIKKEVGLTSQQVFHAYIRLKNGQNDICADDFYIGEDEIDSFESGNHLGSDYDDVNDTGVEKSIRGRKRGRKPSQLKAQVKSKKKEFVGWASRPLFDFLLSIGRDPSEELSRDAVVDIITEYCKEKSLFDPENKKMILCDEKLQTILKRKSVKRNYVYKHLHAHFAENFELYDNEVGYESGDNVEKALENCTSQKKKSNSENKSENKEIVENVQPKSCFASVIPENIKHVYLSRSVVEELLKQPETFDAYVMGSFVRMRSDPYDYMQKNDYLLLQVTGVKKALGNGKEILDVTLQFFNIPKDARIHELSDADFSEEECQDLQRRVKEGLVKRPTVEELEKKARSLHEVITKHRIASELTLLEKRINLANEKGWRKQLFDYVTRRELLRTPEEQSRLLLEIPVIVAQELEVEPTDDFLSKKDERNKDGLSKKETKGTPNAQQVNSRVNGFHRFGDFFSKKDEHKEEDGSPDMETNETPNFERVNSQVNGFHCLPNGGANSTESRASEGAKQSHRKESHLEPLYEAHLDIPFQGQLNSPLSGKQCRPDSVISEEIQVESVADKYKEVKDNQIEKALDLMEISDDEETHTVSREQKNGEVNAEDGNVKKEKDKEVKNIKKEQASDMEISDEETHTVSREQKNRKVNAEDGNVKKECEPTADVIELSDDEEQASTAAVNEPEDLKSPIWYCVGPFGYKSGPHSMSVLKLWMDFRVRELEVKVWKIGQSHEEAVFLADAIRQIYGAQ